MVRKVIDIYNRPAKFAVLKPYDHHAGEDDYVELTEWSNGEGFDIFMCSKNQNERFSLTWGQWDALQAIVAYKGSSDETS